MINMIYLKTTVTSLLTYLTLSVCYVETRLTNKINVHDGGSPSYGLCQLKKETVKRFDKKVTVKKLMNVNYNFTMAQKYLIYQINRYHGNVRKALSAYNAGTAIRKNKKYVDSVLTYNTKLLKGIK